MLHEPRAYEGAGVGRRSISVLHVVTALGETQGGPSWTVPSQCLSSVNAGLRVGAAFLWRGEQLSSEAAVLGDADVQMLPLTIRNAVARLWRAIALHDVVHVYGLWTPLCHLGVRFARLQHKPLVVMTAGMAEPWSLSTKRIKKRIGLLLYQRRDLVQASMLLATSDQEAEHLRLLNLGTPIAVIPEAVPVPELRGPRPVLPNGKRRLLFLSRIHPKKGLCDLVHAVASLRHELERDNWVITLAGPDDNGHLAQVLAEAGRYGVGHLFEYVGVARGDDKLSLYRSADLFVLPTHSENFGLVVAEALACGTPVITTRAAPWKGLEINRCGWWHDVGTLALARALASALRSAPPELERMGQRGRRWIEKEFSPAALGQRLSDSYRWLLGRRQRPTFVSTA